MMTVDFFSRDPVDCARELVGAELVWNGSGGRIVETEAYLSSGDEACHTFRRPSARAFLESAEPGTAYVYLNYGVHWLLNFVVKGAARDGFVLVRALSPTRGLETMRQRRKNASDRQLCSGPGKLTQALAINGSHHGSPHLARGLAIGNPVETLAGPRIGITRAVEQPWRFVVPCDPCLSVPVGFFSKKELPNQNRRVVLPPFSHAKAHRKKQNAQIRGQAFQDHRHRQGCSQPRLAPPLDGE